MKKKISNAQFVVSVMFYCILILSSIIFLFTMKSFGFSSFELAIFGVYLLFINHYLSTIMLNRNIHVSTWILSIVLTIQFVTVLVLLQTALADWVKYFFWLP